MSEQDSVQPVQPVEPAQPVQQTQPVEPVQQAQPVQPLEYKPVQPAQAQAGGMAVPVSSTPSALASPFKVLHVWLIIILLGLILAVNTAGLVMQAMPVNARAGNVQLMPNQSFQGGAPQTQGFSAPQTQSNAA